MSIIVFEQHKIHVFQICLNLLRKWGISKSNLSRLVYRLSHLRSYFLSKKTIYLIYSLGKVGSTTIWLTLSSSLKEDEGLKKIR